ncbi:MAG: DUF29 family protein [bacterium]
MEELAELRNYIQSERYAEALLLIDELEEMSQEDKLNKIHSHAIILLLHLIKQHAEQRSSRSWEFSIANAIHQITRINKRRKSGGHYADEAFPIALKRASLEAFEGKFDELELEAKINKDQILEDTFSLSQQIRDYARKFESFESASNSAFKLLKGTQ